MRQTRFHFLSIFSYDRLDKADDLRFRSVDGLVIGVTDGEQIAVQSDQLAHIVIGVGSLQAGFQNLAHFGAHLPVAVAGQLFHVQNTKNYHTKTLIRLAVPNIFNIQSCRHLCIDLKTIE